MKELSKKYDHKLVETPETYSKWIEKGYFTAGDASKIPYTIVIPPPNVTGKLHLGHAWDNTLQDTAARYKRLKGYDVLYLPGMDHAGIATQAKIDARLQSEGISRYDLGREGFLARMGVERRIRFLYSSAVGADGSFPRLQPRTLYPR